MKQARAEFAAALLVLVVGSGAVLLLATRVWQTVTTPRPRPFADDVLGLSGRAVDAAPTAFALVALAGVVAVIATKAIVRRVIGALIALAGVAMIWRCAAAIGAVSTAHARALVRDKHPRVIASSAITPQVVTHPLWGVLSIVAAVLVLGAGVLIAVRGARWAGMSVRYETPSVPTDEDIQRARARADASLWTALERGEDPTAHDPQDAR